MSTDTDDYAKVNIDMSLYTFGDMIDLTATDNPRELCRISGETTLSRGQSEPMLDNFKQPIDGNPVARDDVHSFIRALLSTVLEVAYNHKVSSSIANCTFAKKDDVSTLNNIYRYISWPYMYGNYNAFEDCLPNPYNNSIETIWQNENRLTIRYIAMNQKGYFVRANIFIFILQ